MTPAAIRALRLKLGLSQAVFAFWSGVCPSTVRRWETGAASPRARSTIAMLRLQRLLPGEGDAMTEAEARAYFNREATFFDWDNPHDRVQTYAIRIPSSVEHIAADTKDKLWDLFWARVKEMP